jgi:trimethylamine--corrinoid protein Co-methyltransferase
MREIRLLEDEGLAKLHHTTLRILAEVGIRVEHRGALRLLADHGANIDWDEQRVWLSEGLIKRGLATVTPSFMLAGSDPSHDVTLIDGGQAQARPVVGADFVVDPGAAHHRPATLQDVEAWIRLVDQLPNFRISGSPYPSDVPAAIRDLIVVERAFELSHKPMLISHYSSAALRWSLELMSVLELEYSRLLVFVSCNSPLTFTQPQLDILLTASEHHVPVAINTAPLAGATAPYTLAGYLSQMNAELLAGVVIAQLNEPGAPIAWSPTPLVFDMRSTGPSSGYAEIGLILAAAVQLGKFYGLPTHSICLSTDAVLPDAQAGLEKVQLSYLALLARPSLIGGAGGLSAVSVASMEQLVIDADLLSGLLQARDGINLSEDALAREAIRRVGPGGHFLEDEHTLRYLRQQYYFAQTANRLSPGAWEAEGKPDVRARATQRVNTLLSKPGQPVVPKAVVKEMRGLMKRAQEELTL